MHLINNVHKTTMCTKLPCAQNYHVRLTIFLNGSDHAQSTRKSRLIKDENKRHENNKGSCGWKQISYWERMEAICQVV